MRRENHDDGMIMVEAVYVVVIAIMIIFFGFNVATVYHNRIILTAIANEAATSAANIYGMQKKEPFYSYMDETAYQKWNPYRHFILGEYKLKKAVEKKCKWYASFLISESEFRSGKDMDFSGIDVTCDRSLAAGVTQLTVTMKREYPAFIMNPVSFFGLDPKYTAEASGTAVCYDIIHQMNTIAFKNEIIYKVENNLFGKTYLPAKRLVNNAAEIINKVIGWFK